MIIQNKHIIKSSSVPKTWGAIIRADTTLGENTIFFQNNRNSAIYSFRKAIQILFVIIFLPCSSDVTDLQQRTKGSIQRQWKHCLSNDWLDSEKAKALPLKKFYVDLKWTKLIKDLENRGVSISSIYDILNVLDHSKKPKAVNILIEGNFTFFIGSISSFL